MNEEKSLKMSFDPQTIEHLGVKMYSNIPNAIAELIANAFDADANNVYIDLYEDAGEKRIEVKDDGDGMSFEDINEKFLRIGRKCREEGQIFSPSGKRKVTGRKGLGKLAFFGIGNTIEISTIKKGAAQKVVFILDWDEIIHTHGEDYKPKYSIKSCDPSLKGTTIVLKELNRKSAFEKDQLAVSLSKLFNLFDNNFKVSLSLNNDERIPIDDKLRYKNIDSQFEWIFPSFCENMSADYFEKNKIYGKVISTEKPLKPGLRGITLFSNGRLINISEFFGVSESSHGFSYMTGWLDVNFVDVWKKDVISTDRQSLNWDLPETLVLRTFLKKTMSELERKWRKERNEVRKKVIKEKTKVDVSEWYKKLPTNILMNIEPVVNKIIDKSELTNNEQSEVVTKLHSLIPEYPYYHWRHLHSKVQDASIDDYIRADYYRAFNEAVKRYINDVRNKSASTNSSDSSMMGEVFGVGSNKLKVSKNSVKPDGTNFQNTTIDNIEKGQKFLSMGIVSGGRNPVSHEEVMDLRVSGLFSEKDCLDALSLLSHLFKRLDDAE